MTQLRFNRPFCLIQKQDQDQVLALFGHAAKKRMLSQLSRGKGAPTPSGRTYRSVNVIPFAQLKEKGYPVQDEGHPILTLEIDTAQEMAVVDLLAQLPVRGVSLSGTLTSDLSDAQFKDLVNKVTRDEIGNGEGANFVIPRTFYGRIKRFDLAAALSMYGALLRTDYGTYWKYIFYDGETIFLGSTPERHLEVTGGKVKMNPISGTFRKGGALPTTGRFKQDLLAFLQNPKEVNELFMVVDEELKMMARMCEAGGAIIGPLLKEMSRLIHTEYLLVGKSKKDIIDLLRDSMFAATVTGSPLENACRIIAKYHPKTGGYYASMIALVGTDDQGEDYLDSPIIIRTLQLKTDGQFNISVGATLVRDSVPTEELKETQSKMAAVASLFSGEKATPTPRLLPPLLNDDELMEALVSRNQNLSSFWFFSQEQDRSFRTLFKGIRIVIIDNADDFTQMIRHMLGRMGARVSIVRYSRLTPSKIKRASANTLFLIGPGPGDPNSDDDKMMHNLALIDALVKGKRKFIGVCLGHQLIARYFHIPVRKKRVPAQGVQADINLFGRPEKVGFYNTFIPKQTAPVRGIQTSIDSQKNILAMRGARFVSYQFHPESILTRNGITIFKDTLDYLSRA
ncbi:MAG: anthranilate synthase family protein [Candidatus Margulisiibacteriota bacterium]